MVISKELSNVFGGLLGMIEGHLAEQMVAHVGVCDMVEDVVNNRPKGSVYGTQGTTEPVPLVAPEMRHEDISVLQVCDEHQVRVGDHVGYDVKRSNGCEPEDVHRVDDAAQAHKKSDVGDHDVHAVAVAKHLSCPYQEEARSRG